MAEQSFHHYRRIVCTHCGEEIDVPVYCGSRFCPICGLPRLRRVRDRIAYILNLARTAPGYQLKMITLTIRNQPDIGEGCRILHKSFRRLRSKRAWKSRIPGGLYVIEVKGLPGHWHVHLHILVDCRFFPVRLLSRCWESVAPGKVVHIKKIAQGRAVGYVTKYISKPSVAPALTGYVEEGLRSVRLYQPFGTWHGLSKGWSRKPTTCAVCGEHSWSMSDIFYSQIRNKKYDRPSVPP